MDLIKILACWILLVSGMLAVDTWWLRRQRRRCPKCREHMPKKAGPVLWWRCNRCDCKYDPATGRRV